MPIRDEDRDFDRWTDVDLEEEAKRIQRQRGMNPDDPHKFAAAVPGVFEDEYPEELIPESEWERIADDLDQQGLWATELVTRMYDQDGEPSCVSNQNCQAHEIRQAIQFGKENVVHLSQIALYMRVGSRSSGSTLSDNVNEMRTIGTLPLDTPENKAKFACTMAGNGYGTKYPENWKDVAKFFRFDELLRISTYQGWMSALLRRYPIGYARDGHSILGARWFRKKKVHGYINSWGLDFGDRCNDEFAGGIGYDSEAKIRRSLGGAVAVRSIIVPSWMLAS